MPSSVKGGNDARLAAIFRRLLFEHHSLAGMSLTINATVELIGDDEFDLIWDELDALDPDPMLRLP